MDIYGVPETQSSRPYFCKVSEYVFFFNPFPETIVSVKRIRFGHGSCHSNMWNSCLTPATLGHPDVGDELQHQENNMRTN